MCGEAAEGNEKHAVNKFRDVSMEITVEDSNFAAEYKNNVESDLGNH